ncbi:MAG: MCE family protein [Burkholderiales bacterium]|nr:MCE family protein [Bacteroidia bacterium]
MKNSNGNKIRLGVFVSIGLALFIIAVYFIGDKQQLFNETFKISGIFKDVSGLQVGNNVRFSGITIGVVENIEIVSDTAVKVDFSIDDNTRKFIKKDAKITIGSDGLMGNKVAIIIPGTQAKKQVQNNDYLITTIPVSIDEIMVNLKVTTANAANITEDLAVLMESLSSGKGTIGKLLMDTVFAKNIDQTLVNIKQGTGGFKQNMDAASNNVLLRGYFKKKKKEKEKK